jgi:hypothetical protein
VHEETHITPVVGAPGPRNHATKEQSQIGVVRESRGVSAPAQRDAYGLGWIVRHGLEDPVLELGIVTNLGN